MVDWTVQISGKLDFTYRQDRKSQKTILFGRHVTFSN